MNCTSAISPVGIFAGREIGCSEARKAVLTGDWWDFGGLGLKYAGDFGSILLNSDVELLFFRVYLETDGG